MNKKELRKEILKARDLLSEEKRRQDSQKILEILTESTMYKETDTILSFVSFGSEVDTCPIIEKALAQKKKVYCPRVEGKDIIFYRIYSLTDLQAGYRGILEPLGDGETFACSALCTERKPLVVLPGTVFDRNGNRIGYGGGFYDRFLEIWGEQVHTAALAFSMQLVGVVPAEPHDLRPQCLITEKGRISFSEGMV